MNRRQDPIDAYILPLAIMVVLVILVVLPGCGEVRIGDRIYAYHEFPTVIGPSGSVAVTMDLERHVLDETWSFGQSALDTVVPGASMIAAAHELDATRVSTETTTLSGQSANVTSDVNVTQNPMPPGGNMPPGD